MKRKYSYESHPGQVLLQLASEDGFSFRELVDSISDNYSPEEDYLCWNTDEFGACPSQLQKWINHWNNYGEHLRLEKTDVVTYSSPSGNKINLSTEQIERLEKNQRWPYDPVCGNHYCSVYEGLHRDYPTFTDDEIDNIIKGEHP